MLKKMLVTFLIGIGIIAGLAGYVFLDNCRVAVSEYSIYSKKIPYGLNNFKIGLISDFHESDNDKKIITKLEDSKPDIIVITGDLINMNETSFENAGRLLEGVVGICPVYFSPGNHEIWSENEQQVLEFVRSKGATVLDSKVVTIKHQSGAFNLIGYQDIIYSDEAMRIEVLDKEIKDLYNSIPDKSLFNVLLFHRGNYFDTVAQYGFDLTLSGHLHGGQINLPVIRETILEKRYAREDYYKGYYRKGNAQMVISGGLEKNFRQPRVFNTPEVVMVTLRTLQE